MNTQINVDINELTVYQALEVMDGYNDVVTGLVNMMRAVREGDEQAAWVFANGITDAIVAELEAA